METQVHDPDFRLGASAERVAEMALTADDSALSEELLSVLLHDLRSPIGAIGVVSDLLASMAARDVAPDSRQIKLLQDSVAKAQRVLEDAVEIQSVIRGSFSFATAVIPVNQLILGAIEKAREARYLHGANLEHELPAEKLLVRVDVEKTEAVILCLLEQILQKTARPLTLKLSVSASGGSVLLCLDTPLEMQVTSSSASTNIRTLRGRLGTRNPGETRYNVALCDKLIRLMGGQMSLPRQEPGSVCLKFPRVMQ